ncbi:hypothetical protein ACX8Z7_05250 [Glutamicibacter endophyticus]
MNATSKQITQEETFGCAEAQRVCTLPEKASLFTQEEPWKTRARQAIMGAETPHKTTA